MENTKLHTETIETFEFYGKDTKRKRTIMLNAWIKDLKSDIEYLDKQLTERPYTDCFGQFAMLLGLKYRKEDIERKKRELSYYEGNFEALVSVN